MTDHSENKKFKRGSTRFKPDQGTYALIDLDLESDEFAPSVPALVFSEAHKGCGLVVLFTPRLLVGDIIKVQVGSLPPLKAEVRWREQIDSEILKIGLMFLE